MRMLLIYLILSAMFLVGCNANKIANIEDDNNFLWQRYMNECEFNDLKKGFSYMEVVEIAGGVGELIDEDSETGRQVYAFPDELLLTQAYEITFINDQLTRKRIVERHGKSEREVEEKKPAVPGTN